MVLRILILTIALLGPGLLPGICSTGICRSPAAVTSATTTTCDKAPPRCAGPGCQASEKGSAAAKSPAAPSCCPKPATGSAPACCTNCPLTGEPRAPPPAPQRPAPPDDRGLELPRPWITLAAADSDAAQLRRGQTDSLLDRPGRGGGGNPIQSVLCIWRN